MRAYTRVVLPVVRPEDVPPDSGCRFSLRCLECPLPMCKDDLEDLGRRLTGNEQRNREIVAARRQGATWPELMARFKMNKSTLRTVWRNHGGV